MSSLISKFYVEYNIYRSGILNATKIFNIDPSTNLALINPASNDLAEGDSIAFRCVFQDTSIFNNMTTCLKVYDVLGNEVATLVNEEKQPGNYEVEFQSTVSNQQLASGIYFYQLRAGEFVQTKKMILLR